MNSYLLFIIAVFVISYLVDVFVDFLNLAYLNTSLPKEFDGFYDAEKYAKSQRYLRENTVFGFFSSTVSLVAFFLFLFLGGFNYLDQFARGFELSPILTGVVFVFSLMILSSALSLPFSLYHTFVIEEKYGFNRSTIKTFFTDMLKGAVLGALIGGPLLALVFWIFYQLGDNAWAWAWLAVTVFQVVMMFVAPVLIMPLFNKFEPLADGELKNAINDFAKKENFILQGIFTMDGSKRSSKANAFFTGFGKFRRIVLFDTLIEKHTTEELVAVLAHEIGHFKRKHILKFLAISIVSTGLMFYLFSLFINNPDLFAAFRMQETSIYASLVFIGILYAPVSGFLGLFTNYLSRKFEFEADEYAARSYGKPERLIEALKKLSVENLSNLTPHPLKVFFEYSHPPVLQRIEALRGGK